MFKKSFQPFDLTFSDEDEDYKQQVQDLRDSIPFAVVGANAMVEVHGKKMRYAFIKYESGFIEGLLTL